MASFRRPHAVRELSLVMVIAAICGSRQLSADPVSALPASPNDIIALASVSPDVFVIADAKVRVDNFIYYLDDGRYFSMTLSDGSQWDISESFLPTVQNWTSGQTIRITHHDWWPHDQFRFVNPARIDPWGQPEEAWGEPKDGLQAGAQFPKNLCASLRVLDGNTGKVSLNGTSLFYVDLSSLEEGQSLSAFNPQCFYLIDNDSDTWPQALWNVGNDEEYMVLPIRPDSNYRAIEF